MPLIFPFPFPQTVLVRGLLELHISHIHALPSPPGQLSLNAAPYKALLTQCEPGATCAIDVQIAVAQKLRLNQGSALANRSASKESADNLLLRSTLPCLGFQADLNGVQSWPG